MQLLLAHAWYIHLDPAEREIMRPYPPLGLLYNSAWLKRKGFDVGIFDATFRQPEDFPAVLRRDRPPVVGIYVTMLTKFHALRMIRAAKEAGAIVVLGGPEPPAHATEFLQHGADLIVVGEGELTLEALLPHLLEHGATGLEEIAGLIYLEPDGTLHQSPARAKMKDLEALPWPDREAIDLGEYLETWRRHHGKGSVSLVTARGCPFKCSWCSHAVYGHSHRRRSVRSVVDEIAHIRDRYNPEQLWIADDVFTINAKWTREWAAEMKARGLRIPFECITRADCLSEELVGLLAETGCFRLWFGSESGSQRILDAMERGVTREEIRQATRWCQAAGIEVGLFVMLGYDGEEESDILQTIDHLKETAADTFLITIAYPIRGTTFAKRLGERLIRAADWTATNDRDARYQGRRSDRYYRFAVMRVVEEVKLHQLVRSRQLAPVTAVTAMKALVKSRVARVGMRLTRNFRPF